VSCCLQREPIRLCHVARPRLGAAAARKQQKQQQQQQKPGLPAAAAADGGRALDATRSSHHCQSSNDGGTTGALNHCQSIVSNVCIEAISVFIVIMVNHDDVHVCAKRTATWGATTWHVHADRCAPSSTWDLMKDCTADVVQMCSRSLAAFSDLC
jgi:hypothetical protein